MSKTQLSKISSSQQQQQQPQHKTLVRSPSLHKRATFGAKHAASCSSLMSSSIAMHRQRRLQQSTLNVNNNNENDASFAGSNGNATWSTGDAVKAHLSLPKRSQLTLNMISKSRSPKRTTSDPTVDLCDAASCIPPAPSMLSIASAVVGGAR